VLSGYPPAVVVGGAGSSGLEKSFDTWLGKSSVDSLILTPEGLDRPPLFVLSRLHPSPVF
jgi:hypothetical protein